ncbi:hypothetical protein VPHPS32B4_0065 [Vibrio phage PS32B-4]
MPSGGSYTTNSRSLLWTQPSSRSVKFYQSFTIWTIEAA